MPVEFALRPRIRLREAPAPARRARARLPKFALPALAYWLAIGGFVYEFVRHHDSSSLAPESEAALALPAPSPPEVRQWWRPLPAQPTQPARDEPAAAPPVPNEPAVAEPENNAAINEPPLAELAPPATAATELPTAELASEREATLEPEARLATNARAARHVRVRGAALAPLEPAAAAQLAPARELPANNVGVPAPPLSFAPLDEPVPAQAFAPAPAPSPPAESSRSSATGGLPSCESAIASASQDVDFSGGNRAADLPTQAIAAVLENGAWLTSCNVPEHTAVDVCVAIKGGHVVGASVTSRPADGALNSCVKRRASSLQFPYSPHLDVARTRF